jgi:hypothetical protein
MNLKWQTMSNCLGMDWFTEDGRLGEKRAICLDCGVRDACLQFALDHEDDSPVIFGGLTGNQRRKVLDDVNTTV